MPTTKDYAFLADNSYRQPSINKTYDKNDQVKEYQAPSGHIYKVLHNASNPATGYQGTIYQDKTTNEIIVAHRGTEPKSTKDLQADGQMLRGDNMQITDAMALTKKAQELANDWKLDHPKQPKPEISVTGHSLGGALAQVTSYKYGLQGETFNAYGAIGLKGMPANGQSNRMTNHVIATDAVSSAAQHFGQVKVYARQSDLVTLAACGYGSPLPDTPKKLAGISVGSAHLMKYFTASDGVLNDTQSQSRAYQFKDMIQAYRGDVYHNRDIIKGVVESMDSNTPQPTMQEFYQKHNQNLNWGAAFGGFRSDATEQLSSPTLASTEPTSAIDPVQAQLLARMAADPNFAQQVTQLMGGQTPSVVAAVTQTQADPAPAMRMEQTNIVMNDVQQRDAPTPVLAAEPIKLPHNIASLHEQITNKFGDQLAHLDDKSRDTVIAMATEAAVGKFAQTVDYIHINDHGKVLMGFDNNIGYSNTVNINDAPKFDSNTMLMASMDLQQTQQQELAQRLELSRSQSGPTMSMT